MEKETQIIVKKYVIEITTYPDGREFQKMYPIGVAKRDFKTKNSGMEIKTQPREARLL